MKFKKREFLKLDLHEQHKKCAALLRGCYENPQPLTLYQTLSSWMNLSHFDSLDKRDLADRYHWHLAQSGRSLKEHDLLPRLRTGNPVPKGDYLPISIYLDRVRSAYNVGSILRTCEALRIGSVHFSPLTPFIDNEKVERTAMGTALLVPCFQNQLLSDLPRPIFVLDTSDDAISLTEFLFPPAFTLVLGNEEYGVSESSLALADAILEIPLLGGKNSINVACAFAIAAAEIRRQFFANAAIIQNFISWALKTAERSGQLSNFGRGKTAPHAHTLRKTSHQLSCSKNTIIREKTPADTCHSNDQNKC